MPLLLADFIYTRDCKLNLRKNVDTTHWPSTPLPWGRQALGSLTQRYFSWHFMGDLLLVAGIKRSGFSQWRGRS